MKIEYMKSIFLILSSFFIIFTCNAFANNELKRVDEKKILPITKLLNAQGVPFFLNFKDNVKKRGYVINFWATWCVPCKKELPDLSSLQFKLKSKNIDVILISIDKKSIKTQLDFLSSYGAKNLIQLFDQNMTLYKSLNLRGIPTTIILNNNGYIVSKHEGILKWGEEKNVKRIITLIN